MSKYLSLLLSSGVILTLLLFSCSKSEIYEPLFASYINSMILATITDSSGEDLLLNEAFIDEVSIYLPLSKKEGPFKIEKIKNNEAENNYLLFNTDLPDIKNMKFNSDNTEAKGSSIVEIKINGRSTKLLCNYKYRTVKTEEVVYGNSSIIIESVELNDKKVINSDSTSKITLHFVVEDNVLVLK